MSSHVSWREAHRALVARIVEGEGDASPRQRRASFDNTGLDEPLRTLINKVTMDPTQISDADMTEVKASGLTDDQIFELVICAAVGQSTREYETARAALDLATRATARNHAT